MASWVLEHRSTWHQNLLPLYGYDITTTGDRKVKALGDCNGIQLAPATGLGTPSTRVSNNLRVMHVEESHSYSRRQRQQATREAMASESSQRWSRRGAMSCPDTEFETCWIPPLLVKFTEVIIWDPAHMLFPAIAHGMLQAGWLNESISRVVN
ncbi:hypothetical protein CIRG_02294 [Coccidioides immitis RMSCC 2394]|uniref:Uncharacterized protein n=1 Tax=Coccidioides immitis RMSCC 2394 TaxID=404692 RepID=A0A0J7AYS0_COCIT|nr:hypothetical protein CIRG_02294 [Coccidioides immitis RMSCC 2394]